MRVPEGAVATRRGARPRATLAAAFLVCAVVAPAVPAGESTAWFWRVRGFHQTDTADDVQVSLYGSEVVGGFSRGGWRIELTVPALSIDGPGTVVGPGVGIGTVVDRGGPRPGPAGTSRSGEGAGAGGSTGSGPGGTDPSDPAAAATIADDGTRSGLGDVRLAFRRWLGANGPWGRMSMIGGVKVPTADDDEALGTGETDAWLGVGWYRQGWTVDLSAYAEWVELGETDAYELESGPAGGVFVVWPVRAVAIEAGVEAAASMIPGAETRTWAVASLTGAAGRSLAWRLEGFYGLSDTATDIGVTFTLAAR